MFYTMLVYMINSVWPARATVVTAGQWRNKTILKNICLLTFFLQYNKKLTNVHNNYINF